MSPHDQSFLKHFAQLIGGLAVLTVVLILGARVIHNQQPQSVDAARAAATLARIAPVGAVFAGDAGSAALAETQAAASPAPAEAAAAPDGAKVYSGLCGACHGAGVAGAPKLEKAAWEARLAQGIDTLVDHASNGFTGQAGMMPARGGNPALTDAEVRAAVQWMVDNLK